MQNFKLVFKIKANLRLVSYFNGPYLVTGEMCDAQTNECISSPCHVGSTCYDLPNSYTCVCPLGKWGTHCELDIDYCVGSQCANNSVCLQTDGGYECVCRPGYTGETKDIHPFLWVRQIDSLLALSEKYHALLRMLTVCTSRFWVPSCHLCNQ